MESFGGAAVVFLRELVVRLCINPGKGCQKRPEYILKKCAKTDGVDPSVTETGRRRRRSLRKRLMYKAKSD